MALWRGGPADASPVKQRTVARRGGVGAVHRPGVHLDEVEAKQRVGLGSISAPGGCSAGTPGLRIISSSNVQESARPATGGAGLAPVLWEEGLELLISVSSASLPDRLLVACTAMAATALPCCKCSP
jgi:hypothetical protein